MKKRLLVFSSILLLTACTTVQPIASSLSSGGESPSSSSSPQFLGQYKQIFANTTRVSEPISVNGKFVSSYVIAYNGETKIGQIYTGTASYGRTTNMEIMVGFSEDASGKTVLGKIYITNNGATPDFNQTVVSNYVDPYNSNPSDAALANVRCGATHAATSIKMIVSEARELFESGGIVGAIESDIKALFPNSIAHTDGTYISGKTYVTSYYAVYSDVNQTNYLGSAYRVSGATTGGSAITLLGAISGTIDSPSYGKLALIKSPLDLSKDITTYNASPNTAQFDSWSNAQAGTLVKAMMKEAAATYSAGVGNLSEESKLVGIYAGTKSFGSFQTISGFEGVSGYRLAYSDTGKTKKLGYIFEGTGSDTFTNGVDESESISITLGVGISGSASTPILGKIALLEDNSFDGAGIQGDYVSNYNSNPSDTTLADVMTGATHSSNIIKKIVTSSISAYKSLN
jgi:hypothetical protein